MSQLEQRTSEMLTDLKTDPKKWLIAAIICFFLHFLLFTRDPLTYVYTMHYRARSELMREVHGHLAQLLTSDPWHSCRAPSLLARPELPPSLLFAKVSFDSFQINPLLIMPRLQPLANFLGGKLL